MKKLTLIFWLIVAITSCTSKEEKIVPVYKSITESVYTSVTIQPDSLYQVYASVAGILEKNLVEENQVISKGTAIVQVVNNAPKLNTENAKLSLTLAKENYNGNAAILKGLKDEIVAAKIKFRNDSINFVRQQNLWNQKIGSKVAYDTKKLNYELSLNDLQLIKNNYNRTESQLLNTVKQAENNYKSSLINTKDFRVKSSITGKVYALFKEPGETVTITAPVATIGSATNFIIEMLVDEVDIVKISKNQKVIINLDAYNGRIFTGKVSKIYPLKDSRNQTFKVEALFDKAPEKLYPGLSGEANIIINKKDSVLTIPKEYLADFNKVKTDDGLVDISIGLQNMEFIEVLSGISKNTKIYKPE
ncbi:efflux RND transporter periplasmic adaptor subunit [Polaribacter sp. Q13]|uniref:efflux RND transporter periplasmic adaptor subunit n=1 Tax=Polaribacter sp. Q13 TaxID=2806551 RepID=UPI00193BD647|nr:HlyD family efflux transporter periplasmic adaptor subunit [Polaribacter sp. Q13]QVY64460.1 HlyD family efflux transporter periplasmic adaptor subunit [Polaribacter sp. Q13]